jgi:hypothetical protein
MKEAGKTERTRVLVVTRYGQRWDMFAAGLNQVGLEPVRARDAAEALRELEVGTEGMTVPPPINCVRCVIDAEGIKEPPLSKAIGAVLVDDDIPPGEGVTLEVAKPPHVARHVLRPDVLLGRKGVLCLVARESVSQIRSQHFDVVDTRNGSMQACGNAVAVLQG